MAFRWSDLSKNIGTDGNRESLLHRYACAILWDELKSSDNVRVNAVGGLTNNLHEGVANWERGSYLNAVLSHIPDIIGRGIDGKPVRVIEIVVTSAPKGDYKELLAKHGVELIEVSVPSAHALFDMIPPSELDRHNQSFPVGELKFWPKFLPPKGNSASARAMANAGLDSHSKRSGANGRIEQLITDLHICSPATRRRFFETLNEIQELPAAFPLLPDNEFINEIKD